MAQASDYTLEILRGKIRGMMNDHSDAMLGGSCQDFADYKHITGVIEGLALAERELLDLDENLNQGNEPL